MGSSESSAVEEVLHTPDPPYCCRCGYTLTGLTTRRCPECGFRFDPPRRVKEARAWFATRRVWLWWSDRTSRRPVALLYALHDPVSIRIARRRVFVALWLPALVVLLTVGAGVFLAVDHKLEILSYLRAAPDQPPIRHLSTTTSEPLFVINGFDLFPVPNGWERVHRKTRRALRIAWPKWFEPVTAVYGGAPLFLLIAAFLPCRLIVVGCARYAAARHGHRQVIQSVKSASSLVALVLGVPMWALLIVTVTTGLQRAFSPSLSSWSPSVVLYIVLLGLILNILAWPRLIFRDHAGKVFPSRGWISLVVASVAAILPAGTVMLILGWP